MLATHRVKNNNGETIGFIVDGGFYTDYTIKNNVDYIDNLKILKNGVIRAKKELPDVNYKEAVIDVAYKKIVKENPFIRDIQRDLIAWKNKPNHRVMQLRGSRQIGKTSELKKFAYKNYEYIIYLDLSKNKDILENAILNGVNTIAMEKICREMQLPHYVDTKNTIIIIDEIQESKLVFNNIRTFESNLNCDIVVTGSYLGRIIGKRDWFLPAGTLDYVYMHQLSFKEFCRIFKYEQLLENIDLYGKSSDADYTKLQNIYNAYRQIGGYPEVIKEFLQSRDIDRCYSIIEKILDTFKEESRKYFTHAREVEIFNNVYRAALVEMCSEKRGTGKNEVEVITELTKKNTDLVVNKNEVSDAITWIQYTGIIGSCNLANNGDMRDIIPNRRIYFCDCGVVSYLASKSMISTSSLDGLITETFVYNELHRLFKEQYVNRRVIEEEVCFSIHGAYELDFMIADKSKTVYGIEVKTKDGDPKSLKVYLNKKLVDKGYVVKSTKGGHGENFDTIPIYTVGCRFPYNN